MVLREVGFEHTHRHSEFSLLDGFARVEEYAERSSRVGQHYLCITDHGMMGAVPRQIRACADSTDKGHSLSPIFGIELYLQNQHVAEEDRKLLTPEEMKEQRKSYHLLALAYNLTGYTNLIQLSTWGWLHGFYYKPRVTYKQLMDRREGVIFTSCCYMGEIGQAFDRGGPEAAEEMLLRYREMFGDNFYLEIMLLDFRKQKPYDVWLIAMHDKYHIPLVCSQDAHYSEPGDSIYQQYMLMVHKKTTIADIEKRLQGDDGQEIFELQDRNLWMKSEAELNEKWLSDYQDAIPLELFEQAKMNSVRICEKARGVEINRDSKLPQFPDENERFKDALYAGMRWRDLWHRPDYRKRLMEEYDLITRKGFASYFLIQKMFTDEARRACREMLGWGTGHEAVGPGRGCLAGDTYIPLQDDSLKLIKDVRVGDVVFSKDGLEQRVDKVHAYDVDEPLHRIYTQGCDPQGCALTGDHPVWCVGSDVWPANSWVPAKDIRVGDHLWMPTPDGEHHPAVMVTRVEITHGVGKVYDLSVPATETFLTTSFAVHNSGVGSLCNYVLGITDVDPIQHGLLFSRFLSEARGGRSMKTRFTQMPLP